MSYSSSATDRQTNNLPTNTDDDHAMKNEGILYRNTSKNMGASPQQQQYLNATAPSLPTRYPYPYQQFPPMNPYTSQGGAPGYSIYQHHQRGYPSTYPVVLSPKNNSASAAIPPSTTKNSHSLRPSVPSPLSSSPSWGSCNFPSNGGYNTANYPSGTMSTTGANFGRGSTDYSPYFPSTQGGAGGIYNNNEFYGGCDGFELEGSSYCYLCNSADHHFYQCHDFTGKELAIFSEHGNCVYIMKHPDWQNATMNDVFQFIETSTGVDSSSFDIYSTQSWITRDPLARCVESHVTPGALLYLLYRDSCMKPAKCPTIPKALTALLREEAKTVSHLKQTQQLYHENLAAQQQAHHHPAHSTQYGIQSSPSSRRPQPKRSNKQKLDDDSQASSTGSSIDAPQNREEGAPTQQRQQKSCQPPTKQQENTSSIVNDESNEQHKTEEQNVKLKTENEIVDKPSLPEGGVKSNEKGADHQNVTSCSTISPASTATSFGLDVPTGSHINNSRFRDAVMGKNWADFSDSNSCQLLGGAGGGPTPMNIHHEDITLAAVSTNDDNIDHHEINATTNEGADETDSINYHLKKEQHKTGDHFAGGGTAMMTSAPTSSREGSSDQAPTANTTNNNTANTNSMLLRKEQRLKPHMTPVKQFRATTKIPADESAAPLSSASSSSGKNDSHNNNTTSSTRNEEEKPMSKTQPNNNKNEDDRTVTSGVMDTSIITTTATSTTNLDDDDDDDDDDGSPTTLTLSESTPKKRRRGRKHRPKNKKTQNVESTLAVISGSDEGNSSPTTTGPTTLNPGERETEKIPENTNATAITNAEAPTKGSPKKKKRKNNKKQASAVANADEGVTKKSQEEGDKGGKTEDVESRSAPQASSDPSSSSLTTKHDIVTAPSKNIESNNDTFSHTTSKNGGEKNQQKPQGKKGTPPKEGKTFAEAVVLPPPQKAPAKKSSAPAKAKGKQQQTPPPQSSTQWITVSPAGNRTSATYNHTSKESSSGKSNFNESDKRGKNTKAKRSSTPEKGGKTLNNKGSSVSQGDHFVVQKIFLETKAEEEAVLRRTCYVKYIPNDLPSNKLMEIFSEAGTVLRVRMSPPGDNYRYCFVEYACATSADKLYELANKYKFDDTHRLRIDYATKPITQTGPTDAVQYEDHLEPCTFGKESESGSPHCIKNHSTSTSGPIQQEKYGQHQYVSSSPSLATTTATPLRQVVSSTLSTPNPIANQQQTHLLPADNNSIHASSLSQTKTNPHHTGLSFRSWHEESSAPKNSGSSPNDQESSQTHSTLPATPPANFFATHPAGGPPTGTFLYPGSPYPRQVLQSSGNYQSSATNSQGSPSKTSQANTSGVFSCTTLEEDLLATKSKRREVKNCPNSSDSEIFEANFAVAERASQVYVRSATSSSFHTAENAAMQALPFAKNSLLNELRAKVLLVALYTHHGDLPDALKFAYDALNTKDYTLGTQINANVLNLMVTTGLLLEKEAPEMAQGIFKVVYNKAQAIGLHSALLTRTAISVDSILQGISDLPTAVLNGHTMPKLYL